ncbi:MAG: FkbM family methyltransferase [Phycisphaerae bacterium]|nr:FkbM family methyltransferase [Phycisphaerae bacterium]
MGASEADPAWRSAGVRVCRGKLHGYTMELNLGRWSERSTYFLERFYDLPLQLAMVACLRPGERFVDIGANIGMISLLASRLVGPEGVVDACEPNPECARRIGRWIEINAIGNIRVREVAVGDEPGRLDLSVPDWNSGEATLTRLEAGPGQVRRVEVDVVPGDALVALDPRPPVMIKIDVEGFEAHVLRGLAGTLRGAAPVLVLEVVDGHLARDGTTAGAIFELLAGHGYRPLGMSTKRRGVRHVLNLTPCLPTRHPNNVLFVKEGSPVAARLDALGSARSSRQ